MSRPKRLTPAEVAHIHSYGLAPLFSDTLPSRIAGEISEGRKAEGLL